MSSAVNIVSILKSIIKYAVNNLQYLIFDQNGNIIWSEAAQNLAQIIEQHEPQSDEEYQIAIIYAIEPLIATKSYNDLDQAILRLPFGLRMLLSTAIGAGKTFLKANPKYIRELVNEGDDLILSFFDMPDFAYLKPAIENAPNLRKWILGYVLQKLNITQAEIEKYAKPKRTRSDRSVPVREKVQQNSQSEGLPEQDSGKQSP
ncbi:MAG: hypothetical protein RAK25_07070 [TACK group archaeon]|nr:hypothetical protein [TACK group archaeon]